MFEDSFLGIFDGDGAGFLVSITSRVAEPSETMVSSNEAWQSFLFSLGSNEQYMSLNRRSINAHILGPIGGHLIVIACLPKERYSIASAASVAKDMLRSFGSIEIGLIIGIGGGAPNGKHNKRFGDIVVGRPIKKEGGVISYNYGKAVLDQELDRTDCLNSPPTALEGK